MRKVLLSGHRRLAFQLMAAGGLATLMSGCSSDVTRLTDPFSNPFSTASNDEAPAVAPRHVASADVIPAGRTPPVSSQALPSRAVASAPISRETTGSIDPGPVRTASSPSFGNWTTNGGTPIQVASGETADVLAKRYGVPSAALLQVNGLHSAAEIHPGSRLTIPVYASTTASRAEPVAPAIRKAQAEPVAAPSRSSAGKWVTGPQPSHLAAAAPGRPVVDKAMEKRPSVAEPPKAVAAAKPLPMQKIATKSVAAPQVAAAPVTGKTAPAPASGRPASIKQQQLAEAPKVAVEPAPAPGTAPATSNTVASADGNPEFRWPAHGRIIQGFKSGSGGNDGINIAVPEGTPVKAAEGGVVAYAGSELKGYGNLVLIRHPNGFVSAYANNGEIDVKRGQTVSRGQEIAKSGQSGNVSSPQLHFELRKGSTPVDPTQFLAGL